MGKTIKLMRDASHNVYILPDARTKMEMYCELCEKEIPYEKELTLTVKISPDYADIYDWEYREANGLWIVPTQEDWYQRAVKDWQETRENAFK